MRNKTFTIIIILICIITFFTSKSFASTDTFSFTGFDGNEYTMPILPINLNNFDGFFIIEAKSHYYFICFNGSINVNYTGNNLVFNSSDGSNSFIVSLRPKSLNEWLLSNGSFDFSNLDPCYISNYKLYSFNNLLYSSDSVIYYKDSFKISESQFIVRPVISSINHIINKISFNNVFNEILGVLPVILYILIALYSVYKAMSFIRYFCNKS